MEVNQRPLYSGWNTGGFGYNGIAARLDDSHGDQALSPIEELTTAGKSARFRADLPEYYAAPLVALTGYGSSLATVITDSVTDLVLRNRRRLARWSH